MRYDISATIPSSPPVLSLPVKARREMQCHPSVCQCSSIGFDTKTLSTGVRSNHASSEDIQSQNNVDV
ncbi:unnamed protein product [Cyprideis torosa]|uniref:Uncharacterized protein n=1 Tax=Cyprideis torosa TaxID=163714 RepID=A0A7R8WDS3_9CRUS|nr:unnamed protein product [Cyprideis torosa]CAG0895023.1 unnamed protein product [Cyprideis torosa]